MKKVTAFDRRLIKCAHLTNLHTCAAFRRGKVWGWIRVRDRVTVWVGVRIRVSVDIKCTFARCTAHLVQCAD